MPMENEPKWPYRKGDVAFGYIDLDTREAAIANAAWLAGRASRDGFVALVLKYLHETCEVCGKMGDLSSSRDWKLRGG